jgi:hypothetical protein
MTAGGPARLCLRHRYLAEGSILKRGSMPADCLNTHHEVTLIEILASPRDRILSRIRFHHTPAHASWLNMAEIEIGVLEEQCLDRRLPDEFTLGTEVVAWEDRRNQQQAKIYWTFTRQKAEKVFCKDQSYS